MPFDEACACRQTPRAAEPSDASPLRSCTRMPQAPVPRVCDASERVPRAVQCLAHTASIVQNLPAVRAACQTDHLNHCQPSVVDSPQDPAIDSGLARTEPAGGAGGIVPSFSLSTDCFTLL